MFITLTLITINTHLAVVLKCEDFFSPFATDCVIRIATLFAILFCILGPFYDELPSVPLVGSFLGPV
jgi:hypothetical protein